MRAADTGAAVTRPEANAATGAEQEGGSPSGALSKEKKGGGVGESVVTEHKGGFMSGGLSTGGGVNTEGDTELRQELDDLRLRFSHVRRRCAGLEARLETEGAVLLAASRRREAQQRAHSLASQRCVAAAVASRDGVASRVVAMNEKGILRATLHGWRHVVILNRAEAAAAAAVVAAAKAPATPAGLGVGALPPLRARKELYRMSYEALIDCVLEWQGVASRLAGVKEGS
jgi:hypothetical protein